MPKLLVTSFNPLSANTSIRKEIILRELGRAHILCLQGTSIKQTGEVCTEQHFKDHICFDWGSPKGRPHNSCGVSIILRTQVFPRRNVARVYSPPEAYHGRFGAVRLKRGDLDVCVISLYMHTEPQKQIQQERNIQLWKYVGDFISRLPRRCTPILCLDANAHVGLIPAKSEAVGQFFPEPQNFNGGLFRTLLETQYMVAANTFFNVGATFFGPPPRRHATRVDYICVPATCLAKVIAICSTGLLIGSKSFVILLAETMFHYRLNLTSSWILQLPQLVPLGSGMQTSWREMRSVVLEDTFCKQQWTSSWDGPRNPDLLWHQFSTALREATVVTYPKQPRRCMDRPSDTMRSIQEMVAAKEALVQCRPCLLGATLRIDRSNTIFLQQSLADILQVWSKLARFKKARAAVSVLAKRDEKAKRDAYISEFTFAWHRRDLHHVWKVARQLSGRRVGPKRRRYDAAKSVRPSAAEWVSFLQQDGSAGGCSAVEVDWNHVVDASKTAQVQTTDFQTAFRLALADFEALQAQARRGKLRKACPPWGVPAEIWRQLLLPIWQLDTNRGGCWVLFSVYAFQSLPLCSGASSCFHSFVQSGPSYMAAQSNN